jgi:aspartate/methionine/tyrosine aminotransferase
VNKPSQPHAPSAEDYSTWMRGIMRAAAQEPDAALLFDSTIREPTDLLAGVVRRAFAGPVTDRYESVFASGNRFVAQAVAKRYGVTPEQVICTTGATGAMAMAIRAFVSPGDHVIVETPCFDLLPTLASEAGAKVSYLPRRAPQFDVDVAELAEMIRPNTKLVLLTHLHNPSGAALSQGALLALAALAGKTGVQILIDEVYGDFAGPAPAAAALSPGIISVGSLTKVQGLFALKCGWAIASPANAERILAANTQGDYAVSKLAHAVAALVLEDMAPFEDHWRSLLDRARPVVERHAAAMGAEGLLAGAPPPLGCMYFPRVVGVPDTRALCDWLWREHRVVVTPGEFFGLPGHVRIGFGGEAEPLDRGLSRLRTGLAQYGRS